MREYFKLKLFNLRNRVITKIEEEDKAIHRGVGREPDHADSAVNEAGLENELLPEINRGRYLINNIDEALTKIGYCEKTGEPIGIACPEAWPIAALSIEAQEEEEKAEHIHK